MTQAINSYNVLIDRFQAFANGHYMINAFTHGILPAIDETKDKLYPWMHVLCSGIIQQAGQAEYSWSVYFFDLPRDKADAHENKREALSDCIRLAQDLIYEIDNGNVLFGNTVDLLPGAQIVPGIDEWTNTLTGVELTFTMAVPDDYDACAIPADFSVGSGTDTSTPGVSSLSFAESLNNTDGIVTLDNDEESPGNTKYYGTNAQGVKGWYTLSATFNCSALENCTVFTNLQTQVQNIEDTYVESVTGLDTDNTDPQNPVVQIAVDGVTITGSGTSADPLVANGGGGAFIPLAGTSPGNNVTGKIVVDPAFSGTLLEQDDGFSGFLQLLAIGGSDLAMRHISAGGGDSRVNVSIADQAYMSFKDGVNTANYAVGRNTFSDAVTYPVVNYIDQKRIQFNGQAAPLVSDDNTLGYGVDSFWIYNGSLYICTDASAGAAVWNQVGSAGATWGSITGTLSDQTDLQAALDAKVDENSPISGDTKTKITYDAKGLVTAGADAGISDITGLQTALDGKVDENAAITGATKTKITYDAKGLVTAGADAAIGDITGLTAALSAKLGGLSAFITSQVDNSTQTEANVTGLSLAVEANATYFIIIGCALECTGTSGIYFGHSFPTSELMLSHWGRSFGSNTLQNLGNLYSGTGTGLINNAFNAVAAATGYYCAHLVLRTTAAGTYQLTFAAAGAAQTASVRAGSGLVAIKMA